MEGLEENYDKLGFYVNSQLQGSQIAGAPDWETFVYTSQSSGTYTFEWRFKKDGSVHALDDCGYVDNVIYSGASAVTPGDVNADGMVDSSDALIILRSAMGLTQLTAQQAASADVNGDGSVDSADALMILRNSMGL